jgi:coenzyme F420 hydrogenase subunit beta
MRSIKSIQDIVDWGLCTGCGACLYACDNNIVALKNIETIGIRPHFSSSCQNCVKCLSFCPGFSVNAPEILDSNYNMLIGATLKIWEGYASEDKIRFAASSGGIISAIASYCVEKNDFNFVVHTGMDSQKPWLNKTVLSKTKQQIKQNSGSRYQTSSPCDCLKHIENSTKPCVFIGRPCDVAAINMIRKTNSRLDANLGLVLSFFCAGTPNTKATIDLLNDLKINLNDIKSLRYRGNGWPGGFSVVLKNKKSIFIPYNESWNFLNRYRPFRCQICPDSFGESADITCGDAWQNYDTSVNDPGQSVILARTTLGKSIVEKAQKAGYITIKESSQEKIIMGQGLVERRQLIFGRLFAMKLLLIPATKIIGFHLFKNWLSISFSSKIRSVIGTLRRLITRGLWHLNKVNGFTIDNI